MQTRIHPAIADQPQIQEANEILRSCVHCGFCTAVCPTYQLLGDELDGPRGRIYLIKNMLEENQVAEAAVQHLDRCLTCRSCETSCPSGVKYGRLLDIGREFVATKVKRDGSWQIKSWLLRTFLPMTGLMTILFSAGRLAKPVLPKVIGRLIPSARVFSSNIVDRTKAVETVILLEGCAQKAATPGVTQALQKVLAKQETAVIRVKAEGCCGALDYHLSDHDKGLARMRDLVDKVYPLLVSGQASRVVSSASGCGVTVKEYGYLLRHDPVYHERAQLVANNTVDASELLDSDKLECTECDLKVGVHTPCTLQHGQQIGNLEGLLSRIGFRLTPVAESHICCGSAGTYSVMQPKLAGQLRSRKVGHLEAGKPDVIVTANIGCQMFIEGGAGVPVKHYLELIAEQLG